MPAQHSIEVIFSFLEDIAIDKLQKSLEKLDVLPIFFIGPVQTIVFFDLLAVVLKAISTFTRFEEPRLDRLKTVGILGGSVGTGDQNRGGSEREGV